MTNEQKRRLQFVLEYTQTRMQEIEAGDEGLQEKVQSVNRVLLLFLDYVIAALPKTYREQAQACLATRDRVREAHSTEIEAALAAWQQKTSPECLPASDSL